MGCTTPIIDLCITQGETYIKDFIWTADDVPVDLTGYTAEAHFRTQRAMTTTLLEATTSNGLITIAPLEGKYSFSFSPDITAVLQRCVYDLFLIAPSGHRRYQQMGTVVFAKAVTRS